VTDYWLKAIERNTKQEKRKMTLHSTSANRLLLFSHHRL